MCTGSLCLSGNNDSGQVRYVETKTQQSKDDLKVYLQGVIDGRNKISKVPKPYKNLFRELFFGKKIIEKNFLRLLVEVLSIKDNPIPSGKKIRELYEEFDMLTKRGIPFLKVYKIILKYKLLSVPDHITVKDQMLHDYFHYRENQEDAFVKICRNILSTFAYIKNTPNLSSFLENYGLSQIDVFQNFIIHCSPVCTKAAVFFFKEIIEIQGVNPFLKKEIIIIFLSHYLEEYRETGKIDAEKFKVSNFIDRIILLNRFVHIYAISENNFSCYSSFITYENLSDKICQQINILLSLQALHSKLLIEKLLKSIFSDHLKIPKMNTVALLGVFNEIATLYEINHNHLQLSSFDNLIWIIKMYLKHQKYAVRKMREACHLVVAKFKRSTGNNDLNVELIAALFFKYEKPWILISNLDKSFYDILEYLIQNNRINTYPSLPLKISKKETQYFYEWFDEKSEIPIRDNRLAFVIASCKLLKLNVSESIIDQIAMVADFTTDINYWEKTAPFFAKYENQLNTTDIRNIVDFLHNNRNYHVKRATPQSIRRAVMRWHEELRIASSVYKYRNLKWPKIDLEDYEYSSEYIIVQLSTVKQLEAEGMSLHHCVSSYIDLCARGYCTIWSLRRNIDKNQQKPLLTIEMRRKRLVQIRGKYNRLPNEKEMKIIMAWIHEYNLSLSDYY